MCQFGVVATKQNKQRTLVAEKAAEEDCVQLGATLNIHVSESLSAGGNVQGLEFEQRESNNKQTTPRH